MKSSSIIMVVAGGYSVSLIDKNIRDNLINEVCVIGVNDSAINMPVDYAISMDRKWLEHRHEQIKQLGMTCYYRACTAKNVKPEAPQFIPFWGNPWRAQMTTDPGHLWGDNSAKVALNLAYQLTPKRVFMLGFDMRLGANGEQHWYRPYSWGGPKPSKLHGWAGTFDYFMHQFKEAGVDVRNVANHSTTLIPPDKIKRLSIEKFNKGAWKEKLRV